MPIGNKCLVVQIFIIVLLFLRGVKKYNGFPLVIYLARTTAEPQALVLTMSGRTDYCVQGITITIFINIFYSE